MSRAPSFAGALAGSRGDRASAAPPTPNPSIESVEPASGSILGGDSVVLTLHDISPEVVTSISFGGLDADEFEIIGARQIRVTTPSTLFGGYYAGPQTVDVVVSGPAGGDVTLASGFHFTSPISIASVTPHANLDAGGGAAISVVGSGFSIPEIPLTYIQICGVSVPAVDFTVVDDSHITFTSPAGMTEAAQDLFLYIAGDPFFGETAIASYHEMTLAP